MGDVGTVMQNPNMPEVRDVAVRKLRDMTIAVAIAAAAGVGVFAWLSATTIPGSTSTSGVTGIVTTDEDGRPATASGDGFTPAPPGTTGSGPGVAVSGGSR